MKKIYCIEKWWLEDPDIHNKLIVNSGIVQKSPEKQDIGILQKNMMMKKGLKMIF